VTHQSLRTPRVSPKSVGVVSGLGVPVRARLLSESQQAVWVFWSVSVSVSVSVAVSVSVSVSVSVAGSGRRWWWPVSWSGSPCWWVGPVARLWGWGKARCWARLVCSGFVLG